MPPLIKIAFCSGTDELNRSLVDELAALYPDLPLYVVSEFPPHRGQWIRYYVNRPFTDNSRRIRAAIGDARIRLSGILLVPQVPYRRMRLIALLLSPVALLAYNEHMGSFMLRPRCLPVIAKLLLWRAKNFLRWYLRPKEWASPLPYWAAWFHLTARWSKPELQAPQPEGISVVIPSRNGRELLACLLPGLLDQLRAAPHEVIVVDNVSVDGTAAWLPAEVVLESSPSPLSFAAAVNRGIHRARFRHTLLLNNDMVLEPDFFAPLRRAFLQVPELFCATAQIHFPEGVRREETGKAVWARTNREDFPVRCDLPLPGEDQSYVLYGSGGCSLYDTAKLRSLGALDEIYAPAYVEDLDLGWRAWQRGWPTVFVSGARVEHRHRATTSRYFTEAELSRILELNYLRFLTRAIASRPLFRRLWREAIDRLRLIQASDALAAAPRLALTPAREAAAEYSETLFQSLCDGNTAVFPGAPAAHPHTILVASPYLPYPLSHGGAVRIYNLMREAARGYNLILVSFSETLTAPAPELLALCAEIVVVRRAGTHQIDAGGQPDTVAEFASPAFRAALQLTVRKWQPAIAQLEFTQMAQYAPDCAPAKTILVEHDITFDLYQQQAARQPTYDTLRQLALWKQYEQQAWHTVDRVITMSGRDRATVGPRAETLANGVDTDRFQPTTETPEPNRILFIGSFNHRPNLDALEFFIAEIWPHLNATLHVIAGRNPELGAHLAGPNIEIEGFVADVRPAYRRAAAVIAPLRESAGTNIKVLEALAMGKPLISTPAGVNGLDPITETDFLLAPEAQTFAIQIKRVLNDPALQTHLSSHARAYSLNYSWKSLAKTQNRIYRELL